MGILFTTLLATSILQGPGSHVGGEWETLWSHAATQAGTMYGSALALVGDTNGDGVDEFAVAAPSYSDFGMGSIGAVRLYSGADFSELHEFLGSSIQEAVGSSVGAAGDVDGDGHADLLVGATGADPGGFNDAGSVFLYSGATGALLLQVDGTHNGMDFGDAVAGMGDLDSDGTPDFVVGAPKALAVLGMQSNYGSVFAFSGATGARLWRADGETTFAEFGKSLHAIDDLDGDGIRDLVVGSPNHDALGGFYHVGSVYLHSGATGALLRRYDGERPGANFGAAVGSVDDMDGDGLREVLVGSPYFERPNSSGNGRVDLIGSRSGTTIWSAEGFGFDDYLGTSLTGTGDVDGDGAGDFLVGAYRRTTGSDFGEGSVYLFSGRDAHVIHRFDGVEAGGRFGRAVLDVGDLDGDGLHDILIGSQSGGTINGGAVDLYSLDPYLHPEAAELSIGGTPRLGLRLEFPASEAGMNYRLLLSVAEPGTTELGGFTIPLSLGQLSLRHAHQPLGRGQLDAQATAHTEIRMHRAVPASLAGRTLLLAALTLDAQGPRTVSSARGVLLVP